MRDEVPATGSWQRGAQRLTNHIVAKVKRRATHRPIFKAADLPLLSSDESVPHVCSDQRIGRSFAENNESGTCTARYGFRPTTRHSPMPVSAENDKSASRACNRNKHKIAVVLGQSVRESSQDSPDMRLRGITRANTPPGFSLRSARTRKIEASPALPWALVCLVRRSVAFAHQPLFFGV